MSRPPPDTPSRFSPEQVQSLILDFLSDQAHYETARAFARALTQSSTPALPFASLPPDRASGTTAQDEDGDFTMADTPEHASKISSEDHGGQEDVEEEEEEDDETEERNVSASLTYRNGNGKAKEAVTLGELDDDVDDSRPESEHSLLSARSLREIRQRKDVRDCIQAGRIQAAIRLINEHFPAVLAGSPSAPSTLPETGTSASASWSPRTFLVPARDVPPQPPRPSSASSAGTAAQVASSTVLRPTIISLNLQIQALIEMIRSSATIDSETLPDALNSPSPPSNSSTNGAAGGPDDAMSASISSISSARTTSLNSAMMAAQSLMAQMQALPSPAERALYSTELNNISALLAYLDPTTCTIKGYLEQDRRDALARLCNAAILVSTGRTATPILELAVRQTTAIFGSLVDWKVAYSSADTNGTTGKAKKLLRSFDLAAFLDEPEYYQSGENGGQS